MNVLQNIQENLPLIIAAIALVGIQYFMRRRRGPGAKQQEIVQNLLGEARLNLRLTEVFTFDYKAKRFITTTWRIYKNGLDYLPQKLQEQVNNAFMMTEDFNGQIAAAKKNKSTIYMSNINMDKLKGLLESCKEGLEQWLLLKVGSKDPPLKAPGMFDDLLGKR